jgi:iron(III) transport system substrate-binding protein
MSGVFRTRSVAAFGFAAALVLGTLGSCDRGVAPLRGALSVAGATSAPGEPRRLTIYSPHPEDMTAFVVKEFRQRTGIAATVVSAGTGELLSRLRTEADAPRADVLWGGGAESLDSARDLFAPYRSGEAAAVPAEFKDGDGLWTGFSVIPMVIIYNRALVPPREVPRAWKDLVKPFFRGRVAFADPEKSGSAYTALATLLRAFWVPAPGLADGPLGTAESWAFIDELKTAIGGETLPESEAVYGGVAAGEYFAGISFETAALLMRRIGSDLEFVYPAEGTSAVPDGVALIAGSPHRSEAEAFIDFVLSREVQAMVCARWFRRSVRQDVDAPTGAPPLSQLRLVPYERRTAGRERERVLTEWRRRMGTNQ